MVRENLDFVVASHGGVFLPVACTWMKDSLVIVLRENTCSDVVGGISYHDNRLFWVELHKDWSGGEGGFEGLEDLVCF